MKTIKSVHTVDEKFAKITGHIINALVAMGGVYAIFYAVQFFGPKLF